MCLGVPGRLVERLESVGGIDFGLVEFGGLRRKVCTGCVPDAEPGDYVIVHAGVAITRIDAAEAERILRHLEEMGEATEEGITSGDGVRP
jgi:hydrogenase expression/formation protein HypC